MNNSENSRSSIILQRRRSRLWVLFASYQEEYGGQDHTKGLLSLSQTRWPEHYVQGITPFDEVFFKNLLESVVLHRESLADRVSSFLPMDWPLHRLDSVLRLLLIQGFTELLFLKELYPIGVVDEYTGLASCFVGEKEISFINGILHKQAHTINT